MKNSNKDKNSNEIILKMFRDFMIPVVILSVLMIVFGILLAIGLTGHTMFKRVVLSVCCCIVPAVICICYSVGLYVGVRREIERGSREYE